MSMEAAVNEHTSLHGPCFKGHFEMVKYLVKECKMDVNEKDEGGNAPVHYAVTLHRRSIVEFLIEDCKADVEICDEKKRTVLMLACEYDFRDVVNLLVNISLFDLCVDVF